MSQANSILTHKVTTLVSLALSIYGNLRYFVGRTPGNVKNPWDVSDTPFTANLVVVLVFWLVLHIHQVLFVSQIFIPSTEGTDAHRLQISQLVGWHFTLFNLGQFVWTLLFVKQHFFWSEAVVVLNFLNILALYFTHKTFAIKPFRLRVLIHWTTAAVPLSWLLFALFWNGAVLFHVHKFVGRVVSNVLIWDFLLVGGFFLVAFNDYGVGLSTAILQFGLGLGQLFTKLFALQWIFAFIIAGLLVVGSVVSLVNSFKEESNESAPLLETA